MTTADFKREKLYQTNIAIVRTMKKNGLITEDEFCKIDTMLLEKYQPLLGRLQAGITLKTLDNSALLRDI
jgi:hypothetical protein